MPCVERTKQRRRRGALAAAALVMVIWCGSFVAIRVGVGGLSTGSLVLLRFLFASLTLVAVARWRGDLRMGLRRDMAPTFVLLAVTGVVAYNLLLSAGQTRVSAAGAAVLINTAPLWATLFARPILGERAGRRAWIGLAVAFAGVSIVAADGGGVTLGVGVVLILAAALSQALYFVIIKRQATCHGALPMTAATVWTGTLLLLPLAPGLAAEVGGAPRAALLAALYLGVVVTIGAVLWTHTLVHLRTAEAMALLFTLPPLTALAEWLLLGQMPSTSLVVGGAVTLSGVGLAAGR